MAAAAPQRRRNWIAQDSAVGGQNDGDQRRTGLLQPMIGRSLHVCEPVQSPLARAVLDAFSLGRVFL